MSTFLTSQTKYILTIIIILSAATVSTAHARQRTHKQVVTTSTAIKPSAAKGTYRQVKTTALSVMRWCALKGHAEGERWAGQVALRFGGPDKMLQTKIENIKSRPTSKTPKKVSADFKSQQEKLALAAKPLFALWQSALQAGRLSLATEWAQDLAAADPNHDATHKALGYEKFEGHWKTPRVIQFLKTGGIQDPVFGWVKKENQIKFQNGKRLAGKKFVSKFEADRYHKNKSKPYKVLTEHFQIYSCRPLEEAVAFGKKAEALHETWVHLFASFLKPTNQNGGENKLPSVTLRSRMPMRIYYCHDARQYAALSGMRGGKGNYDVGRQISFFYPLGNGKGVLDGIFFHEVSHQLFCAYSLGAKRGFGFRKALSGANNFLIEGLATYMEGYTEAGGKLHMLPLTGSAWKYGTSTGGGRTNMSVFGPLRIRLAADYFRKGTAESLTAMLGLTHMTFRSGAIMQGRRLDRYSEAAALCHFLMHHDDGAYQEKFGSFVRSFYEGKALSAGALAKRVGVKNALLQTQWKQYMLKIPSVY